MKVESVNLDPRTEKGWRSGYLGYGLEYVEVTLEDGQRFHISEIDGNLRIRAASGVSLIVEPISSGSICVKTDNTSVRQERERLKKEAAPRIEERLALTGKQAW